MAYVLTDTTTAVNLSLETDAPSLTIMHRAYAETSRLSARILDELSAITILTEHEISLTDGGVLAFAGYVRSRTRTDRGVSGERVYEIECQDYTTALGDDVCDTAAAVRPAAESDKTRIAALGTAFGSRGIVYSGTPVVQLKASMPAFDYTGLNLHQCLTAICKVTGGSFYVGFDKQLHYFNSEAISAPFGLSDAPNGTTTFGYDQFRLTDDSAQYVNAVFVTGTGISGWRTGGATVASLRAAGTLRAMSVNDPEVVDATTLNAVGDAILAQYGTTLLPASLVTYTPGLRAGQNVQVTHAGWGISAVTYRIAAIEARAVDANRIAYQIFFGSNPISFEDLMRQSNMSVAEAVLAANTATGEVQQVLDLSTGGANLVPNSSFEDGTVWAVGSSWVIGFAAADAYQGAKEARYTPAAIDTALTTPFITVDRTDVYWASAWIFCRAFTSGRLRMLVEEYDAASTLLATTVVGEVAALDTKWNRVFHKFAPTVAAGYTTWQATTTKVKIVFRPNGVNATGTWSVDGVQLERGGLLTAYGPAPYELFDGQVLTVDIADDAITTPKLIANAVTTGKLAAFAVTAAQLAAQSVTADKISVGAIDPTNFVGDGKNLCPNPGFEFLVSGQPTGWSPLVTGHTIRTDGNVAFIRTGRNALQMVVPTPSAISYSQTLPFPVQGGRRYRFNGWSTGYAGNAAATAASKLCVRWFDGLGVQIGADVVSASRVTGQTQAWGSYWSPSTVVVAPTNAVTAFIFLQLLNTTAGDRVYVDDIEFELADQDVDHAGGNVTITSLGLTITNGLFTVQDDFGIPLSMSGRGFGAAWLSFMRTGIYNSDFGYGLTTDMPVTIVGTASTLADYAASLTTDLPYWIVKSSASTLKIVTDATAPSGKALESNHSATGQTSEILQDVPIVPGMHYRIALTAKQSSALGGMNVYLSWRDVNHAIIGTEQLSGTMIGGVTTYHQGRAATSVLLPVAPANAAFLRVSVQFVSTGAIVNTLARITVLPDDVAAPDFVEATLPLSDTTVTTTSASCTNSASVTIDRPSIIEVTLNLDINVSTAGVGVVVGDLQVDSPIAAPVNAPGEILYGPATTGRSSKARTWRIVADDLGAWAFTGMVKKTINAGVAVVGSSAPSTLLQLRVYAQ
jgi:hypothetical protein